MVGYRFYKGAYHALKEAGPMGVLVSIPPIQYSVYNGFCGDAMNLYFEASAVVITLIMLGK